MHHTTYMETIANWVRCTGTFLSSISREFAQDLQENSRKHLTERHHKTLAIAQTGRGRNRETKVKINKAPQNNFEASLTMCPFHIISSHTRRVEQASRGERKKRREVKKLPCSSLSSTPCPFHRSQHQVSIVMMPVMRDPDVQRETWHCSRSFSHPRQPEVFLLARRRISLSRSVTHRALPFSLRLPPLAHSVKNPCLHCGRMPMKL
jgi:hypothetical protein